MRHDLLVLDRKMADIEVLMGIVDGQLSLVEVQEVVDTQTY
jgi:hypothetical protein